MPDDPPSPPRSPKAFDPQTHAVIGAAIEVHRVLGPGFLERVYHLALANELGRRGIPFEREVKLPVTYKGDLLECHYRVDLLCYGSLLVELKALPSTGGIEDAQVLNYLVASTLPVALLLNFGEPRLHVRRFAGPTNEAWLAAPLLTALAPAAGPSVPSVTSVDRSAEPRPSGRPSEGQA